MRLTPILILAILAITVKGADETLFLDHNEYALTPLAEITSNKSDLKKTRFDFPAKYFLKNIALEYSIYGTERGDNPIYLNDNIAGYSCMNKKPGRWRNCTVLLNASHARPGLNRMEFRAYREEYKIANMTAKLTYLYYAPYLVVATIQAPENLTVKEEFEVSILFSNIGIQPVYNLTAVHYTGENLTITNGTGLKLIGVLEGAQAKQYGYQAKAETYGRITLPQGIAYYHNCTGQEHNTTIPEITLEVKPPAPKLLVRQSVPEENITVGEPFTIALNITNQGETPFHEVKILLNLPGNSSMLNDSSPRKIGYLKEGESRLMNYKITIPATTSLFHKATVTYTAYSNQYKQDSNEKFLSIVGKKDMRKSPGTSVLLRIAGATLFLIIFLYAILAYLRKKNQAI